MTRAVLVSIFWTTWIVVAAIGTPIIGDWLRKRRKRVYPRKPDNGETHGSD